MYLSIETTKVIYLYLYLYLLKHSLWFGIEGALSQEVALAGATFDPIWWSFGATGQTLCMGKTNFFGFGIFINLWTGSGRGSPSGNVRVDLDPDVPPKYGPRTSSRSEVIDFTVNH